MTTRTIKIGNMCCGRCIVVVKQVLTSNGVKYKKVELGSAVVYDVPAFNNNHLEKELKKSGFEIIVSSEDIICEKIKIAVHRIFFDGLSTSHPFNLKKYLESETEMQYKKLAEAFSRNSVVTIERYFILHRIEKVKVMIEETGFSFSEIAFHLGYSSLSHLSRQFKEIEGISMHDYKHKKLKKRKPIDKLVN